MSKIPLKIFWSLWKELASREHKTDFGLGKSVGVSSGTVAQWKSKKVVGVLPDVLSLIEKNLGYKIRLSENNEWQITKLGETITEPIKTERLSGENAEKSLKENEVMRMLHLLEIRGVDDVLKLDRLLRRYDRWETMLQEVSDESLGVQRTKKLSEEK
jgi:hypothetical protein